MRITDLIKPLGIKNILFEDFIVRGISCNSKEVKDNFIFAAVKGSSADGNKFIAEAIKNGARAILVHSSSLDCTRERQCTAHYDKKVQFIRVKNVRRALAKLAAEFYGNPSEKLNMVGVTGTNGKTTVTYLIEAILKEAGFLAAVIGTINYRYQNKIFSAKNTTPGPIELQSILSDIAQTGITYCLMEVSSHALDQERVAGIDFHSAIFTNFTQDHLDYHKTLKGYFRAKAKLFKNLEKEAFALVNNDDKYSADLKKITPVRVFTYGIKNKANFRAQGIKSSCSGTEFRLITPDAKMNFKTGLIGKHNVYNILAACAWARIEGIDLTLIRKAIERFRLVPGRLEKIDGVKDFSVFVDYAHTEDALYNIIRALREVSRKRIIIVFGCGGDRDRSKRPKMGRVASELCDYAVITSDNPRSENPQAIIREIRRGIRKDNYCVIPQRLAAIRKAISLAKPQDVVLVCGKGHEHYQIIGKKKIYFDDRQAVKQCLKSLN